MRVQIHPRFDAWMRGDRYADVLSIRKHTDPEGRIVSTYTVKLDKSGKRMRLHEDDVTLVD